MNFSGVLLAGGKSRRFDPNKIKIISEGVPLVIEQVVKLSFTTNEIIISTSLGNKSYIQNMMDDIEYYIRIIKIPQTFNMPGIKIVTDDIIAGKGAKGIGPIAGIYTGLKYSKNDLSLVIASDMPFISLKLLKLLIKEAQQEPASDAIILKNIKGIEALCGIYSKKCIKIIEEGILKGVYKISDILKGLKVRWIEPEKLNEEKIDIYNFFNINSQKDVEEFVKIRDKGVKGHGTYNIHSGTGQKWKDHFFRGIGRRAYKKEI